MKFLVIDFEIIERGGINRIVEGLHYGLEALGCQFDYYWASRRGGVRNLSQKAPTMVNKRYYRLPARQLAYRGDQARRDFARLVRNYDVVMFMLPCPHDIKSNMGDMSWMMLYQEAAAAGKPIVGVIHDNLWDTYYPWYRQVSGLVSFHLFTCYQSKYDSLARLPGHYVFLPTPLDVRKAALCLPDKIGGVCWMPQWKKWKGIYPFIKALPEIQYPVNLYNAGIEYHNIRKRPGAGWKDGIGLDHVGRRRGRGRGDHQYWGAQLPGSIPGIYQRHDVSVDLSGSIGGQRFDGQTSCVMLEAMLYGCVSAVSTRVQEHRWSPLAGRDVTWGLPASPSGIAEAINELMADQRGRRRIAYRAMEFVKEYSDARTHAATILDHLENESFYHHGPGLARARFWDNVSSDPAPDGPLADLTEYVSPHALRSAITELDPDEVEPDERDTPEDTDIEELPPLDIVRETVRAAELAPALLQVDTRLTRFITKIAQAWIDVYGQE